MRFPMLVLSLALTACATNNTVTTSQPVADTQLARAVTSPLSDLNLVQQDIPAILVAAQTRPYAVGPDRSCHALGLEIRALDAALGADLDMASTTSEQGLADQGAQAVGDAAIDAVRGAAEGVLPFRGWLRKLTGAERRDREHAAAIAAGTIRRAYLKGRGQSLGCQPPAAPRSAAAAQPTTEPATTPPRAKPAQFVYVLKLTPAYQNESNWTDVARAAVGKHFQRLTQALQDGRLILAGKTSEPLDKTFGLVVFEADNEAAARAFAESDPAVVAGVMSVTVHPYAVALPARP